MIQTSMHILIFNGHQRDGSVNAWIVEWSKSKSIF